MCHPKIIGTRSGSSSCPLADTDTPDEHPVLRLPLELQFCGVHNFFVCVPFQSSLILALTSASSSSLLRTRRSPRQLSARQAHAHPALYLGRLLPLHATFPLRLLGALRPRSNLRSTSPASRPPRSSLRSHACGLLFSRWMGAFPTTACGIC